MNQQDAHVTKKMAHGKWLVLFGALALIGIALYQTSGEMVQQRHGAKMAFKRGAVEPCLRPAVVTVQPRLPRRKNVYFRFGKIPKPLVLAKKLTRQATNGQFKKLRQAPRYKGPNVFVPVSHVLSKRKGPPSFDGLISFTQQSQIWMSKLLMKLDTSAGIKICRFVSRGQATFQMNVRLPMRSARQQRIMKFEVTYTSGCFTTHVVIGMKSLSGRKHYQMVVCDAGLCRVYVVVSTYRLVRDVQKQKVKKGKWILTKKPNAIIAIADMSAKDLEEEYEGYADDIAGVEDAGGYDDDEF